MGKIQRGKLPRTRRTQDLGKLRFPFRRYRRRDLAGDSPGWVVCGRGEALLERANAALQYRFLLVACLFRFLELRRQPQGVRTGLGCRLFGGMEAGRGRQKVRPFGLEAGDFLPEGFSFHLGRSAPGFSGVDAQEIPGDQE